MKNHYGLTIFVMDSGEHYYMVVNRSSYLRPSILFTTGLLKVITREDSASLAIQGVFASLIKVKNSAIIYSGYDYQTLHGVKLLAEWLHSPIQYVRMAFEADMDSNETLEAIDDIFCERGDGVLYIAF